MPDQTRALIKYPDRYEPEPNRTYDEFATHYGCAVLAARPAHPRDKPKVEGSVLLVERWILARLRNRRFFSLGELNGAIGELLVDLNQRAFKKLPGCRASAFKELDAPALRPLPVARYEVSRWKSAKVNIDYHVEFDGHYYSVPHALVGTVVELRVTASLVECFTDMRNSVAHFLLTKGGGAAPLHTADGASYQAFSGAAAALLHYGVVGLQALSAYFQKHLAGRLLVGSVLPMHQHRERFRVVVRAHRAPVDEGPA